MTTNWFCGNEVVQEAPLHYTWGGLDDVYLLSGFTRTVEGGEVEYSIQNLEGLHRAIAKHLAEHKKTLTGKQFRFIRKQLDVSQDTLGRIFRVTDQTVARWEKDECEIPGPADLLIRLIYLKGVDATALAARLSEVDSIPDERQVFKATGDGWQPALAA
jgi:DNA-binding transcriptional regulator YiaG